MITHMASARKGKTFSKERTEYRRAKDDPDAQPNMGRRKVVKEPRVIDDEPKECVEDCCSDGWWEDGITATYLPRGRQIRLGKANPVQRWLRFKHGGGGESIPRAHLSSSSLCPMFPRFRVTCSQVAAMLLCHLASHLHIPMDMVCCVADHRYPLVVKQVWEKKHQKIYPIGGLDYTRTCRKTVKEYRGIDTLLPRILVVKQLSYSSVGDYTPDYCGLYLWGPYRIRIYADGDKHASHQIRKGSEWVIVRNAHETFFSLVAEGFGIHRAEVEYAFRRSMDDVKGDILGRTHYEYD